MDLKLSNINPKIYPTTVVYGNCRALYPHILICVCIIAPCVALRLGPKWTPFDPQREDMVKRQNYFPHTNWTKSSFFSADIKDLESSAYSRLVTHGLARKHPFKLVDNAVGAIHFLVGLRMDLKLLQKLCNPGLY